MAFTADMGRLGTSATENAEIGKEIFLQALDKSIGLAVLYAREYDAAALDLIRGLMAADQAAGGQERGQG